MATAGEITALASRALRTGVKELATYSIAGNIVDNLAAALEGVAVVAKALNGDTLDSTVTDSSGDFSFPAGFPGSSYYNLYATLTGYTPDSDPLVVTVAAANVTDADFVLTGV